MRHFLTRVGRWMLRTPRSIAWIPPALWGAVIWWLSSRPIELDGERGAILDLSWNFAHAPAFGLLALLCVPLARRRGDWVSFGWGTRAAILLAVGAFGALDEYHQSWTPGRVASAWDLMTDFVGASAVVAIVAYLSRPDAAEGGLRWRLGVGFAACLIAASASTF